jgi:hypothetical protein
MQSIKWIALMLYAAGCVAQEAADPIAYTCVPETSEFSVSIDAVTPALGNQVSWGNLIQYGPQKNGRGDPLRTGTRSLTKICGELSIRFKGGYLNSNVTGQDGAIEFPIVEIRRGKKLLLASTALAECDMGDSRMLYFGVCPARWAVSVRTEKVDEKNFEIAVERRFFDMKGTIQIVSDVFKKGRL